LVYEMAVLTDDDSVFEMADKSAYGSVEMTVLKRAAWLAGRLVDSSAVRSEMCSEVMSVQYSDPLWVASSATH